MTPYATGKKSHLCRHGEPVSEFSASEECPKRFVQSSLLLKISQIPKVFFFLFFFFFSLLVAATNPRAATKTWHKNRKIFTSERWATGFSP